MALILVAGICCTASDPDPLDTVEQGIVSGTPTSGRPEVAALRFFSGVCGGEPPVAPFCSSVVVAPRVLVTAAHCVIEATASQLAAAL